MNKLVNVITPVVIALATTLTGNQVWATDITPSAAITSTGLTVPGCSTSTWGVTYVDLTHVPSINYRQNAVNMAGPGVAAQSVHINFNPDGTLKEALGFSFGSSGFGPPPS